MAKGKSKLKALAARLGLTADPASAEGVVVNKTERFNILVGAGAERLHAFLVEGGQPENEQKPYGTWTAEELATMLTQQEADLVPEAVAKIDELVKQLLLEAGVAPEEPEETPAPSVKAAAAAPGKELSVDQKMAAALTLLEGLEKRLNTRGLNGDARTSIKAQLERTNQRIKSLVEQGAKKPPKKSRF